MKSYWIPSLALLVVVKSLLAQGQSESDMLRHFNESPGDKAQHLGSNSSSTRLLLLGRAVKPDPEAVAAGNRWFGFFDNGDYKTAHRMYVGVASEGELIATGTHLAPLGHVVTRQLVWARFSNKWPGAPDGNYEWLHYKTSYEHEAHVEEDLRLTKRSGHWEVSGFQVR